MSQAGLIDIEGSNPQIPTEFDTDSGSAVPIGNVLEILGGAGITTSGSGNTVTIELSGGGSSIDSVAVQTGTSPITPDGSGLITINGAVVAAGTNPIRSDGTGANTLAIEVQISQALAAADATKIGLSNFDSAAFDVSATGFVQLKGGGIASTSFDVQANTGPGTDPVVPTAAGSVIVNGAVVANHSVVLETRSRAANTYNLEVQYATSAAATDGTKSGVSHFNSSQFSVDASGFVSTSGTGIANTITGDSGGALSPTAGNWNILGLSGSKTSGTGSTLTIKSPPYADVGVGGSVTLNSGSFATAAITLTTPVTAGLTNGDLLEFVATNGTLIIQLAATQVAHLGSAATSVTGTMTSNATGDALVLRYQASTNDWWATSSIGTWTLA